MKRAAQLILIITSSVVLFGCRQLYTPPIIKSNISYLVVDGVINPANDTTTNIKLSHTVNLNAVVGTQPETSAQVTVESDANASYPLKETKTKGTYTSSAPLNLNTAAKYRLRIITAANKTYLSDFVPVKNAAPIDSLNYTLPPTGLQIAVNAHDPTNNTRYYRYEYVETWMFHTFWNPAYIALNNQILARDSTNQIYICWNSANSTSITLASSAKLTQDVVYNLPIATVPAASEKLQIKYSIQVKEYALTENAFNFWQLVKKNTEQLGSIFDAQPSQIRGNIHNVNDSSEPVFGYISAGTVQQKRIFISNAVFPRNWATDYPYAGCAMELPGTPANALDPIPISPQDFYKFFGGLYVPIADVPGTPNILGAPKECADCTLRGTNKKPYFGNKDAMGKCSARNH